MQVLITVSIPVTEQGDQEYWTLNIASHTKARILNGVQLDFYRALGIPEHVNQAPQILDGYREI